MQRGRVGRRAIWSQGLGWHVGLGWAGPVPFIWGGPVLVEGQNRSDVVQQELLRLHLLDCSVLEHFFDLVFRHQMILAQLGLQETRISFFRGVKRAREVALLLGCEDLLCAGSKLPCLHLLRRIHLVGL